jgi:hypothetical protein
MLRANALTFLLLQVSPLITNVQLYKYILIDRSCIDNACFYPELQALGLA